MEDAQLHKVHIQIQVSQNDKGEIRNAGTGPPKFAWIPMKTLNSDYNICESTSLKISLSSSVLDTDPVGSGTGTFSCIRNYLFRIRIQATLTRCLDS